MQNGVRGKYTKRYQEGTNIVLLEPDIAEAFPNDAAVNQALRGVLNTTRAVRGTGRLAEKSLQTSSQRRARRSRRACPLSFTRFFCKPLHKLCANFPIFARCLGDR
jgi:hypothetical protein